MQPALFVSHGAPSLAIEPTPAHHFLRGLGRSLPTPQALLIVSAHWEQEVPTVTGARTLDTIHDFHGFAESLREIRYPATGDPALAARVVDLLGEAGFDAGIDHRRGLDHGAWVPASLAWPDPPFPVLQLSLVVDADARSHFALGRALAPLRAAGVLVVGSGGITHNLSAFRGQPVDADPAIWAQEFEEWIADGLKAGGHEELYDWERHPYGRRNHPSPEHLMPLFVAAGAGGDRGVPLHRGFEYGVLAMDVWRFD